MSRRLQGLFPAWCRRRGGGEVGRRSPGRGGEGLRNN